MDFQILIIQMWVVFDLMDEVGHVVEALHDYSYEADQKDGTKRAVRFKKGDRFILLKKSNVEWWDVILSDEDPNVKHFYVPARYVKFVQPPRRILESRHPGNLILRIFFSNMFYNLTS